jgi:hypothetical protein
MNLQVAMPIEETLAIPPAGDAAARTLAAARLRDEGELLDALEARREQLGLSNATVENLAGLARNHLTKCMGPARRRSPSLRLLDQVMRVYGLSFVLVLDPAKLARAQSTWQPRNAVKVTPRPPSSIALTRSRPILLEALLRRASHPKWKHMTPKAFIEAQQREAIT